MPKIDYWAEIPITRKQIALFSPTLDSMIDEGDPVRIFDESLNSMDWSLWEGEYDGKRGQPPIHPRHVAGAMLYGLCRGIRSTRKLEEACHYRVDFMWLLHGLQIDHTTFSKFRTKFQDSLKDLFKQIGRKAMTMGLIRLGEVAFDGTRVKANNSRYTTLTAKTLKEKLAELDALFDKMMAEMDSSDAEENQKTLPGHEEPLAPQPEEIAKLEEQRRKAREALDKAKAADAERKKQGMKTPAQVPTTDPDSRVMPNKEGGYAPNYTPTATTDGERGFIVDGEVVGVINETNELTPSVDRIEEVFGERPENMLTDGGNNAGRVMQEMEERDVTFYAPVTSSKPQEGNPAKREDPTQPVPEDERDKLPLNSNKKLDKSCFVYDEEADLYYCPQGHLMPFEKTKPSTTGGVKVQRRVYRCLNCSGCPLVDLCLSASNEKGRTVTRDGYEESREATADRMAQPAAKELYNQRPRIAETPFGILKSIMGIRQFLLRGLDNVKTEWTWAITAFNLGKLVREIARMRADFTKLIIANES